MAEQAEEVVQVLYCTVPCCTVMGATNQSDLKNNPRLLQQVCSHVSADDVVTSAEADLNVLSKATAVVISGGFGVSNSLADREKGLITVSASNIVWVNEKKEDHCTQNKRGLLASIKAAIQRLNTQSCWK